jgi:uncharacterized damage-inducible protein DinB
MRFLLGSAAGFRKIVHHVRLRCIVPIMNSPVSELSEQLLDTWRISVRVGLYALEGVDDEGLGAADLSGRTPGQQFAHIHRVRRMWLEHTAPDLYAGVADVDEAGTGDREALSGALVASGAAIEELLRRGLDGGRIEGYQPHPTAFAGYLVAHEAYHLGDIGVRLSQAGHPLSQQVSYGLWKWGTR